VPSCISIFSNKKQESVGQASSIDTVGLMNTIFSGAGFWLTDNGDKLEWIGTAVLIQPARKHKDQFDIDID
jgi:hypothetical protein